MMNVWVVSAVFYNSEGGTDVDIIGLFTRREDAAAHADECPWPADVEEYELNKQYVPWWVPRVAPPADSRSEE